MRATNGRDKTFTEGTTAPLFNKQDTTTTEQQIGGLQALVFCLPCSFHNNAAFHKEQIL